jgi:hypothetical protein
MIHKANKKQESSKMDDGWTGLILLALLSPYFEAEQFLDEFEEEIQNNNRFFPKGGDKINKLFQDFSKEAFFYFDNGTFLYRARKADSVLMNRIKSNVRDSLGFYDLPNDNGLLHILKNLSDEEKTRFNNKKYWGFNAGDSNVPPPDKATAGRINPDGISYLYASEDVKTAIAEMRPLNRQFISVAKIKITKRLKLFDFSKEIPDEEEEKIKQKILFKTRAKRFSYQNYGELQKYYVTQYISEILKKDYDGIRFNSSLKEGCKNIVLFEPYVNYKIINSSMHMVRNVNVDEYQILPLQEKATPS